MWGAVHAGQATAMVVQQRIDQESAAGESRSGVQGTTDDSHRWTAICLADKTNSEGIRQAIDYMIWRVRLPGLRVSGPKTFKEGRQATNRFKYATNPPTTLKDLLTY